MTDYAASQWARALKSLASADLLVKSDPDGAASRAYYAAFYALSALLALEGRFYTKHSAVEVSVHRDLVKAGRLGADVGAAYSKLLQLRAVGDYGGMRHVTADDAADAALQARAVLKGVKGASNGVFA